MSSKKIMILGVGEAQENLIKEAKNLGYFTIVCDMRTGRPGEKFADKYYRVNYMDKEAILRIAREEQIDGVISNSEPAMESVSYLVDTLFLPGNSSASLQRLLSKNEFRKLQQQVGVFCPQSFETLSWDEAMTELSSLRYPIIIKPSESSGSRGATMFKKYDKEMMMKAFQICQGFSRNDYVTIEEYVPMKGYDVFNADIFLVDGNVLWDGWYGGKRSKELPMVPMTKILPPIIQDKDRKRIQEVVNELIIQSGVSLGEFNVETYITTNDEIFVIEINPRQAGDDIPKLIFEHTGIDLTRLLVSLTVDDRRYFNQIKDKTRDNNFITLQVVFPHSEGVYQGLYIDKELRKYIKWVHEFVNIGDRVSKAQNAEDSVAYVDFRFDSRDIQEKYTNEIEKYIYPIIG